MLEVVENKVKKSLKIKKINVWVFISTISTFVISLLFLYFNNVYFRLLFILPIIGSYYYWYRLKKYKKDIEYLPKFLLAYSRLKEKEPVSNTVSDGNIKEKIKIVYKNKIVYRDKPIEKIVYRDKYVDKIIEKITEVPVEKIIYKDKIIEKIVYKEKKSKIKKGYIKKKNIYINNNIIKDIEDMLAKQFYNIPLKDRAIRIYSMINQINVDKKDQFEYEKENS